MDFYENKHGYEVALEEAKRHFEAQRNGIDAIKSTAQHILNASSVVFGLITTFQLFMNQVDEAYKLLYYGLFGLVCVFYVALAGLCVAVISPIEIFGVAAMDWELLYEYFVGKEDDLEIDRTLLSSYLNVIHLNEPKISARRKMVNWVVVLFPVIVALLFGLSLFPR